MHLHPLIFLYLYSHIIKPNGYQTYEILLFRQTHIILLRLSIIYSKVCTTPEIGSSHLADDGITQVLWVISAMCNCVLYKNTIYTMWSEGSCGIPCLLIIFTLTKISKLSENKTVGLSGQDSFFHVLHSFSSRRW